MPVAKVYKCDTCQLNIGKSQGSVRCGLCGSWFHAQCAKLNEKTMCVLKEVKSLSFTCENCEANPSSGLDKMLRDEIGGLNYKIDSFLKKNEDDLNSIKRAFCEAVADLKSEVSSCRTNLQADIVTCGQLIKQMDVSTSNKITSLEAENNLLHKRLNRADVVISGLPAGLDDLVAPIIKLCSHFGQTVNSNDINYACYMYKRKAVLVKFNNVFLRDRVMKSYFMTKSLKLCDLLGGEIESRVYLNDHFTPAVGKLNSLCRRLLRLKRLSKFKLLNSDLPKVKLILANGNEVIYGVAECAALLDDNVPNDTS